MRIIVTGGSGFIGTNYIEFLLRNGQSEFINIDNRAPRNKLHNKYWKECNILDANKLRSLIMEFSPTHVIHLAAQTGIDDSTIDVFAANTKGVENMLSILKDIPSLERVIFTSTMLVCEMGYIPKHEIDYKPSTIYGESKVIGEQIVRSHNNLPFLWTIIRPIGIWGPWGESPYYNLFMAIKRGWFFHIGQGHYKRNLGYVENSVYQIHKLLLAPKDKVDRKTMYLSDEGLVDLYDFTNEIQRIFNAPKIRHLQFQIVEIAAKFGDILKSLGWGNVPLTTFRFNNMITQYNFNLNPIMEISGSLPHDTKSGIARTIEWMQEVDNLKLKN